MRNVFDEHVEISAADRQRVQDRAREELFLSEPDRPPIRAVLITAGATVLVFGLYVLGGGQSDSPLIAAPTVFFLIGVFSHWMLIRPRFSACGLTSISLLLSVVLLVVQGANGDWHAMVVNLAAVSIAVVCARRVQWCEMRPYVRKAMVDLGVDEVCLRCGYRLKGLAKSVVQCPECGEVRYFARGTTSAT